MKNLMNFFRNYEEVKIGNDTINIEHSPLENMFGCAFGSIGLIITSPIWAPALIGYGLYSAGEYGYKKIKGTGKIESALSKKE